MKSFWNYIAKIFDSLTQENPIHLTGYLCGSHASQFKDMREGNYGELKMLRELDIHVKQ